MFVSKSALRGGTLQVPQWKDAINANSFYKVSCLLCFGMAILVNFKIPTLVETCPMFPWTLMMACLTFQGIFCYLGDVTTWGQPSVWKALDVWLAIVNTCLYGFFALLPILGWADWPIFISIILLGTFTLAGWCKSMSLEALRCKNLNSFIVFHSMWHWIIAAGATTCLIRL